VIEAHLEDLGGRRVAGDVPAQLVVVLVRAHDHHHGVPAANRADALLEGDVAAERR